MAEMFQLIWRQYAVSILKRTESKQFYFKNRIEPGFGSNLLFTCFAAPSTNAVVTTLNSNRYASALMFVFVKFSISFAETTALPVYTRNRITLLKVSHPFFYIKTGKLLHHQKRVINYQPFD